MVGEIFRGKNSGRSCWCPLLSDRLPCAQPCVLNTAEEAFPQKRVVPTFISFTSKARASEFLFLHKPWSHICLCCVGFDFTNFTVVFLFTSNFAGQIWFSCFLSCTGNNYFLIFLFISLFHFKHLKNFQSGAFFNSKVFISEFILHCFTIGFYVSCTIVRLRDELSDDFLAILRIFWRPSLWLSLRHAYAFHTHSANF